MADMGKMAALLYLVQKSEFHILEVEALAKVLEKPLTFDIVGPKGRIPCKFRDAHYGIFDRIDGGSMHVKGFQFVSDIHCENVGGFE